CRGPVLSVKALFRTPPERVRTLAIDEGSRTSAVLVQVLLDGKYGVHPDLAELPLGASPAESTADAVVVIGDRAIRAPEDGFLDVWDLGGQWRRWTGLPFVFAVWAARPGVDPGIAAVLDAARDRGCESFEEIARERSAAMTLPYDLVLTYLSHHLNFYLDQG